MPKITESALEQTEKPITNIMEAELTKLAISHSFTPVFVCGVNRKINTGNFENIDIYAGITLPLDTDPWDVEAIKEAVAEAAELGFALTSTETGDRYSLIKEMQKQGRNPKP